MASRCPAGATPSHPFRRRGGLPHAHVLVHRLPAGFPVGARQDAAWERGYARFDEICADRGNRALIDHDTTADVARDLDLMRRAVHDPVLNYLGVSYGTVLGATYAGTPRPSTRAPARRTTRPAIC